ncbi:MAG: hypothetical protein K2K63_11515, partial [Acetatifactor sp.]|nr:hypothetical protein [Acetatifactor sp.]
TALAGTDDKPEDSLCADIAEAFRKVSDIANEMNKLIGYWDDTENMLKNLGSRSVREKLGGLIDRARLEDTLAYEQIKTLLNHI